MGSSKMLIWFIAFAVIFTISMYFSCSRRSAGDRQYRELRQEEIRPLLKRITGRELPDKANGLRAILYSFNGLEELFVAFQTDQKGFSYILDVFGGQDVLRREFPHVENNPFGWDTSSFLAGCEFQKKIGVVLFDEDMINRIQHDALEHAQTGSYPKDAVTGYYLEFNASSKLVFYRVLVFKDKGLVYICADRKPEGVNLR